MGCSARLGRTTISRSFCCSRKVGTDWLQLPCNCELHSCTVYISTENQPAVCIPALPSPACSTEPATGNRRGKLKLVTSAAPTAGRTGPGGGDSELELYATECGGGSGVTNLIIIFHKNNKQQQFSAGCSKVVKCRVARKETIGAAREEEENNSSVKNSEFLLGTQLTE